MTAERSGRRAQGPWWTTTSANVGALLAITLLSAHVMNSKYASGELW
jgi:hypothetical protein